MIYLSLYYHLTSVRDVDSGSQGTLYHLTVQIIYLLRLMTGVGGHIDDTSRLLVSDIGEIRRSDVSLRNGRHVHDEYLRIAIRIAPYSLVTMMGRICQLVCPRLIDSSAAVSRTSPPSASNLKEACNCDSGSSLSHQITR